MRLSDAARLVREHPHLLARRFGHEDLVGVHDEWMKAIIVDGPDQTILAHRGSYKTSSLADALTLWMWAYPSRTCKMFRKTDKDVSAVMHMVAANLATPEMAALFSVAYGTVPEVVSTNQSVTTSITRNVQGEPQLMGMSMSGSVTGRHADLVVTDDIVTLKDRLSRAEREHTKSIYRELQNVRNRGGRIVNFGTPWHQDDAISTLMPNIRRWMWNETGLMTEAQADELRGQMTPSLFAANYELRHIADEDAVFLGEPETFDDFELLKDGIMHVDAAYGGEDGTACTVAKWANGKMWTMGQLWPSTNIDLCLSEIVDLYNSLRCRYVAMEKNSDKGYLARQFKDLGLRARTYSENVNKHIKIVTYGKQAWRSLVRYEDGSRRCAEYWNQVADYTEDASHDDAPDSLACAARLVMRNVTGGLPSPLE